MVLYLNEEAINEAVSGQEVVKAIDHRNAVLINYAGENNSHSGKRYIEPYVYGTTKAGNPCIRAYQYWGDSKKGVPRWKLFRLDRISSWEPTRDTFEIEPKARGWAAQAYNQQDRSMSEVFRTVDLGGNGEVTDLDRLRDRTRRLQNAPRLNIRDINVGGQQKQQEQPQKPQAGPIQDNGQQQGTGQQPQTLQASQRQQEPQQQSGPQETPKVDEPKPAQAGPIAGDTTNPEENRPEELMSNDEFQRMLRRNLELTQKEKDRRNNLRNRQ